MNRRCKNCRHFVSKGIMPGSANWGLCTKSTKEEDISGDKKSPFFRWEDDTCSDFKPKKELSNLQSGKTQG